MREVNKCQNKCRLESSREPLVKPLIRSMSRKMIKIGTSFEKFSPKASKYISKNIPKKKRESTRLIERRKSTLQPSSSRSSKLRRAFKLMCWNLVCMRQPMRYESFHWKPFSSEQKTTFCGKKFSHKLKAGYRDVNNESCNAKNRKDTLKPNARTRFDPKYWCCWHFSST